jgi:hypothetical protein
MAEIPNSSEKIFEESVRSGSAVAEDGVRKIGAAVNYLLDQVPLLDDKTLKSVTFTSNGTFTVPADVTHVILEGCGGGGGGAGQGFEGRGGFGAAKGFSIIQVTPNDVISVVIGSGGSGGGFSSRGGDGASTTFGALANFQGAPGGYSNTILDRPIPQGVCFGGGTVWVQQNASGPFAYYKVPTGQNSQYGFTGGLDGWNVTIRAYGGGAGPYGNGGNGASFLVAAQSAGANTGAGGGGGQGGVNTTGGNGGSGRLIVAYISKF